MHAEAGLTRYVRRAGRGCPYTVATYGLISYSVYVCSGKLKAVLTPEPVSLFVQTQRVGYGGGRLNGGNINV